MGLGAVVTGDEIEVVLPTYNGAHYLEAQLASIYAQSLRPARVFLRDDGSTDGTLDLIAQLQQHYGNWLQVLPADGNLGCTANVNRLLEATSAVYVALADQDDLWLSGKLEASRQRLQQLEKLYGADTPLLVHSDLELVDQQGRLLGLRFWCRQQLDPARTAFLDLALTNVVTGCTVLLNRPLLNQALPIPPEALIHDWWLALVASTRGRIGVLASPGVLYRQHQANVLGAQGTAPLVMLNKLRLPEQRRPPAVLRAVALQSEALSLRLSVTPHPLVSLLHQPRWRRGWRLFRDASLRCCLRKHGPLRTWGFWLVLCLVSPQSRSMV
jgi:hypothetical protein